MGMQPLYLQLKGWTEMHWLLLLAEVSVCVCVSCMSCNVIHELYNYYADLSCVQCSAY